jgi:hypothetical protein
MPLQVSNKVLLADLDAVVKDLLQRLRQRQAARSLSSFAGRDVHLVIAHGQLEFALVAYLGRARP